MAKIVDVTYIYLRREIIIALILVHYLEILVKFNNRYT